MNYLRRQMDFQQNIVGQDFLTKTKAPEYAVVSIIGDIVEAINFDASQMFIQWEIQLPDRWQLDIEELVELEQQSFDLVQLEEWNRLQYLYKLRKSITQTSKASSQKTQDGQLQSVAHFCFPFDLQMQVHQEDLNSKFPILLLQVNSFDSWDRNRIEGYGFVEIPHAPGYHELRVKTYKPHDDIYTRIYEFFLGGAIKVKDFPSIASSFYLNNNNQKTVLNRFNVNTESSGDIIIRVNVSIQKDQYKKESIDKHETQMKEERKEKLREIRELNGTNNLGTTLFKGSMGYINRYQQTGLQ